MWPLPRVRDRVVIEERFGVLLWLWRFATEILAGVIAEIVVQPPDALASVPDWLRYAAVVAGFIGFIGLRKSIFAGVICGEIVLMGGKWWLG